MRTKPDGKHPADINPGDVLCDMHDWPNVTLAVRGVARDEDIRRLSVRCKAGSDFIRQTVAEKVEEYGLPPWGGYTNKLLVVLEAHQVDERTHEVTAAYTYDGRVFGMILIVIHV